MDGSVRFRPEAVIDWLLCAPVRVVQSVRGRANAKAITSRPSVLRSNLRCCPGSMSDVRIPLCAVRRKCRRPCHEPSVVFASRVRIRLVRRHGQLLHPTQGQHRVLARGGDRRGCSARLLTPVVIRHDNCFRECHSCGFRCGRDICLGDVRSACCRSRRDVGLAHQSAFEG